MLINCVVGYYTLSTRTTEAPKSAKTMPQNGDGAKPAISNTLIPFKDILQSQI